VDWSRVLEITLRVEGIGIAIDVVTASRTLGKEPLIGKVTSDHCREGYVGVPMPYA
jgi:hypothetical protein